MWPRNSPSIFRDKAVVIGSYMAAAALFWVLLSKTVFGRHVRAIGDNPTASVYAGLPILKTQLWVYSLTGLLAGFAGVLYAAENHQGNPNAGVAYELDAIAAVVIGGTRLSGGQGTITGTIIGTLIIGVLTNILQPQRHRQQCGNDDQGSDHRAGGGRAADESMTMKPWKFVAAAAALVLAGCGEHGAGQKLVAFSQANNAEPYRAAQKALMEKLFGETPDVKLVSSDAQQDNSKQIAQIETFIRQKPAVLIVAPNERAALTAVMGKAMEAGIPIICLERDIVEPNYTTYIRMDNRAIGRMAGQFIVDQLTKKYGAPKGNVVFLRGLLGVEAEINRDGGARDVLSRYPDIHIVADPVANWIQAEAQ